MRSLYTSYMDITIAYSTVGSAGSWMSVTDGVCGSVDGRGILLDFQLLPVENMLQSFGTGELGSIDDRAVTEDWPLKGLGNWTPALWGLGKVVCSS